MNERIQELHEQAMKSCDEHRSDILNYHRIYREKFAELIVRECCGVLTENVEVALDASGSPVYPEGLIYEHFGVEE